MTGNDNAPLITIHRLDAWLSRRVIEAAAPALRKAEALGVSGCEAALARHVAEPLGRAVEGALLKGAKCLFR